jgi:hypothetical protein
MSAMVDTDPGTGPTRAGPCGVLRHVTAVTAVTDATDVGEQPIRHPRKANR